MKAPKASHIYGLPIAGYALGVGGLPKGRIVELGRIKQ